MESRMASSCVRPLLSRSERVVRQDLVALRLESAAGGTRAPANFSQRVQVVRLRVHAHALHVTEACR